MKHTVMIGPSLIPTDSMIFEGSKHLFSLSGVKIDEYIVINDDRIQDIVPINPPTHIIVLGTPWVWDKCWYSNKYINTIKLFEAYPEAKRCFLGVGSCLPLGKEKELAAEIKAVSNSHLHDLFKDSLLIVRDMLAADILEQFKPVPLPCPAFYALATEKYHPALAPVIIWHDPSLGISQVDYQPGSKRLEVYQERFRWAYDTMPKAKIFCVSPNEVQAAIDIGLPAPTLITGLPHAKIILNNAQSIVSGRVHLAVPAYQYSRPLHLEPVDSRATVLHDVFNQKLLQPSAATAVYIGLLSMFRG